MKRHFNPFPPYEMRFAVADDKWTPGSTPVGDPLVIKSSSATQR
jgi:hypothetical protein